MNMKNLVPASDLFCSSQQTPWKPINGHFERLVVIDLLRLGKKGSINGLQNDKDHTER